MARWAYPTTRFTYLSNEDGYREYQLDLQDNNGIGGFFRITIERTYEHLPDRATMTLILDEVDNRFGQVAFEHTFDLPIELAEALVEE